MECAICVESFNKTIHTKCVCPHCEYASCRTCVQQYILTFEEYTISCMSCKKNWTIDTLDGFITKTFRNTTLKEHREKILFDRERSLLPATQPEVQRSKNISECKELISALTIEHRNVLKKIDEAKIRLNRLYARQNDTPQEKEIAHFTIHCPSQTCKGFVASKDWKCGLCDTKVCKKCHECIEDDDTHVCIEENIETAKLIKKDSKSCPGCSALIFKISGCNQMWCTQCHTTFRWDTGTAINGNIHNPHFYEWLRQNGQTQAPRRTHGDVPCGGLITPYQLKRLLEPIREQKLDFIYNVHRYVLDMQQVRMPFYRTNPVLNNMDLRIMFLLDNITEAEFKITLQQREKKMMRYREIYDVLEMFLVTLVDMFNNLQTDVEKLYTTFEKEVRMLFDFGNNQLYKISKRYNCTVPVLCEEPGMTIKY